MFGITDSIICSIVSNGTVNKKFGLLLSRIVPPLAMHSGYFMVFMITVFDNESFVVSGALLLSGAPLTTDNAGICGEHYACTYCVSQTVATNSYFTAE